MVRKLCIVPDHCLPASAKYPFSSFTQAHTYNPELTYEYSFLTRTITTWNNLMCCLLKATPSIDIYSILIAPLQLTALTYLLAWFSKERLNLPCSSSQISLGAHSCFSPLQLGSLLCLMNLLRNTLILPRSLR